MHSDESMSFLVVRTADAPEHEPEDEAEEADPHVPLRPPAPAADLLLELIRSSVAIYDCMGA